MTNVIQPSIGNAIIQYKLVLDKNKVLNFNPERVTIVDAEIKDSVYGPCTAVHTLYTNDLSFIEGLKQAMSEANPIMEFRLGFGSPKGMYWLPWQRHIIEQCHSRYEGVANSAGNIVLIKTSDNLIRLERSNKVVARRGTIAEIVQAIAAENKLEVVVEPTDGNFLLYQSFIDDTRFVRERLMPRAINKSGRGGYYFYIRDNVLHFHTPDYQCSVSQLNYYNTTGASLVAEDLSQVPDLWDAGVAGVKYIDHDPYTGFTQEVSSNPDKALKLSESLYKFSNVANGQWNVPYHRSFNPLIESTALAQHMYQKSRQSIFKITVALASSISLRHGDLVNINITQQVNTSSSYSGYYLITGLVHKYDKGAVNTVYRLERGEIRGNLQSLTTQNAQNELVSENLAPGQVPNLREIESSQLTKGAGTQAPDRTYLPILSPK